MVTRHHLIRWAWSHEQWPTKFSVTQQFPSSTISPGVLELVTELEVVVMTVLVLLTVVVLVSVVRVTESLVSQTFVKGHGPAMKERPRADWYLKVSKPHNEVCFYSCWFRHPGNHGFC